MSNAYKNAKAKVICFPTNDSSLMTAKALDAYMRFRSETRRCGIHIVAEVLCRSH